MLLLLFEVTSREKHLGCAADRPRPARLPGAHRLRIAEIERDYGLHDRAEAPQYFAPPPPGVRAPS